MYIHNRPDAIYSIHAYAIAYTKIVVDAEIAIFGVKHSTTWSNAKCLKSSDEFSGVWFYSKSLRWNLLLLLAVLKVNKCDVSALFT